jgi:hypothetical protein
MNRDELRTQTGQVTTADANFGSVVPANMRRYIYGIKVVNEYAGANLLTLGKREDGAGSTTVVDYWHAATQYESLVHPDELKEDALPLYAVEGKGSTGDSYVRAVTDLGNAYLTIWYVDAPA